MIVSLINRIIAKFLKFIFELGMKFYLSEKQYGEFVIILSLALVISGILNFGMSNFILKKFPRIEIEEKNNYLLNILLINSFLFIVALICCFFTKSINYYIVIISFFISIINIFGAVLQSFFKIDLAIYFMEVQWYIIFFLFFFTLKNYSINDLKIIKYLYFSSLLINVIIFYLYIKYNYCLRLINSISKKYLKEIFENSLPVLLTGISYTILSRMDVLMINKFLTKNMVGNYNVVARITTQLLFVSQILLIIYIPKLSKNIFEGNKKKITSQNKFILNSSLIATLLIIYFFILFNNYLNIFDKLGVDTKDYLNVFLILTIEKIIYSFLILNSYIIYFYEKNIYIYINSLLILLLNYILNYLLIPRMGVVGATISTSISIIVGHLIEYVQIYTLKKNILRTLLYPELIILFLINFLVIVFLIKNYNIFINYISILINLLVILYYIIKEKENVKDIFFNKK